MTYQLNNNNDNLHQGFPGGTVVKNSPANAGHTKDSGLIPGWGGSPGGGSWGRKESDMTG